MMETILRQLSPQLNKIGESLRDIKMERGIADPEDVRIVIFHLVRNGKVHTMMMHVRSTPTPTQDDPNQRTDTVLLDGSGEPMIYNIAHLPKMLSGD